MIRFYSHRRLKRRYNSKRKVIMTGRDYFGREVELVDSVHAFRYRCRRAINGPARW